MHRSEDLAQETFIAGLEMTEEAVKKRLLRGRKMLLEEVVAFVAGTLRQTTPGKAFTMAVIASLPAYAATTAAAATVGTTAFTASSAAKVATGFGISASVLGPLIGFMGALFGSWLNIKSTRSPRERQFMLRQMYLIYALAAVFTGGFLCLSFWRHPFAAMSHVGFGCTVAGWPLLYCVAIGLLVCKANRRQKEIRKEDGTEDVHLEGGYFRSKTNAYITAGGSTIGAFGWFVTQQIQSHEWITASAIVIFATVVIVLSGRALYRYPERRNRILLLMITAIRIFMLLVCCIGWRECTQWVRQH